MIKKFLNLIKYLKKNYFEVIIQLHNFPDPDSIASGIVLKKIFQKYKIKSEIFYFGSDQRMINRLLINFVDVSIMQIEDEKFIDKFFDKEDRNKKLVFCVDGNPINSNFIGLPFYYIGFIDHHIDIFEVKKEKSEKYKNEIKNEQFILNKKLKFKRKFIFKYSNVGSTSTIIYLLAKKLKIKLDKNMKLLVAVGLYTDTFGLRRNISDKDLKVFFEIYKEIDKEKFLFFTENSFQKVDIKYIIEALNNLVINNGIAKTFINEISNPVILGIIGDLIIKIIEVNFVLIFGFTKDIIYFSTRSINKKYNCIEFIEKNLGDKVSYGGHSEMAAGIVKSRKYTIFIKNYLKK